jgi:ABC-2 type transport system permease protein
MGLFFDYFVQYFKVRVSYRGDFLIGLGTSFAATIFSFMFVYILFSKKTLPGWTFEQILFLYGFSMIPFGLFNVLSLNIYEFGGIYIMEGKFDRVLLRPVNSLFQVLFEAFRLESLQEVITGIVIVVWASSRLRLHWGILDVLLFVFFGLCGAVIYVSFFSMLSTVSFWFEDRIGVHPPAWNLIAFGRYPLTIYSTAIGFS